MKYFFPITLFFFLGCNNPILDTDRSIFIQKLDALKFLSKYHDQLHIMIGEEKGDADKAFKEFSNALRANNNSELIPVIEALGKIKSFSVSANFNIEKKETTSTKIILKTLGFTYLNAHVYSDTVFFLGNFSKNFLFDEKIYFAIGASVASFIFFFLLGYSSVYFSRYAQSDKTWKYINGFIISFMSLLTIYIIKETAYFL